MKLPEGTLSVHGKDVVIAYDDFKDARRAFAILEEALSPAEPGVEGDAKPVAELHGPFGWLNGCRGLSEDSWALESDPLENSDEYFAIPLYALSDPFKEIGALYRQPLAAAHPSLLEEWRGMDSAPKDGTWIIAYRPSKGVGYLDRVVIVRWDDEVSSWVWPDQPFDIYEDDYAKRLAAQGLGDHIDPFEDNAFTHWMPLPSAPVEEPTDGN